MKDRVFLYVFHRETEHVCGYIHRPNTVTHAVRHETLPVSQIICNGCNSIDTKYHYNYKYNPNYKANWNGFVFDDE